MSDPSMVELIRDAADKASARGDTIAARNYYRAVLAQQPHDIDAMLALAQLIPVVSERQRLIAQAQVLEPDNPAVVAAAAENEKIITQGLKIIMVPASDSQSSDGLEAVQSVPPKPIVMCAVHATMEASLRCTSCDRPMCVRCTIPNEVGQLCPTCRYKRIPERYRSELRHWLIAGGVSTALAAITPIPLVFLLSIPFIGPLLYLAGGMLIGSLSAQITLRLTAKRGRPIIMASGIGVGIGSLIAMLALFGSHISLMIILLTVLSIALAIRSLQQTLH
ncbi:MAG: hypothetical protein EBS29_07145 [Chloroflexia bacterium]|nr:hypothetical protein [Chloroflexia bacterium]